MTDKTDPEESRQTAADAPGTGRLAFRALTWLTLLSGIALPGLPEGLAAVVVPALWTWGLVGLAYALTALGFRLAKGILLSRSNGDYARLLWRLLRGAPFWYLLSLLLLAILYLDGRPVLAGLHALRLIADFLFQSHRKTGGPLAPA